MMKVEYLYGRSVKDVRKKAGYGFVIEFEDGTQIIYEDSDANLPEHIEGHVFTLAAFAKEKTTLHFGKTDGDKVIEPSTFKIELAPMQIGVRGRDDKTVYWPQRGGVENEPLPDDPSAERVSSGPVEASEEEQEHEE